MAQALEHRSVRLIAGELRDKNSTILESLRMRLAVRVCAVEPSNFPPSSSMLFVGPVGYIMGLGTRDGGDWPVMLETRGSGFRINEPADKPSRVVPGYFFDAVAFLGKAGEDESRGWPFIESVKQKKAMTVLPHTKKD